MSSKETDKMNKLKVNRMVLTPLFVPQHPHGKKNIEINYQQLLNNVIVLLEG